MSCSFPQKSSNIFQKMLKNPKSAKNTQKLPPKWPKSPQHVPRIVQKMSKILKEAPWNKVLNSYHISIEKMRTRLRGAPARSGGATSTFTAVLQLFCPAALLPGLLRCLCRLLLPFWAFTAFVGLLPGLLRCLCRLLLPFWAWATLSTFTAFLGFYCLCRLLLNQSTVADFVDF